jgi:hypothetical protein
MSDRLPPHLRLDPVREGDEPTISPDFEGRPQHTPPKRHGFWRRAWIELTTSTRPPELPVRRFQIEVDNKVPSKGVSFTLFAWKINAILLAACAFAALFGLFILICTILLGPAYEHPRAIGWIVNNWLATWEKQQGWVCNVDDKTEDGKNYTRTVGPACFKPGDSGWVDDEEIARELARKQQEYDSHHGGTTQIPPPASDDPKPAYPIPIPLSPVPPRGSN